MTSQEPPQKKVKSDGIIDEMMRVINECDLRPVLSEQFAREIPDIKVVTANIKDKKNISKVITELNDKLPLDELNHLKRVRNNRILLIKAECIDGVIDTVHKIVPNLLDDFQVTEVPAEQPMLQWQHRLCNKKWPCNFHPNKYLELLYRGSVFSDADLEKHRRYMVLTCKVLKFHNIENVVNVCIVVDPLIDSIVALAKDNRCEHPLQHAAMLAIDNVAKTQDGGAWNDLDKPIDPNLKQHLLDKDPNLTFDSRPFRSKKDTSDDVSADDNGPYLCTGYYVYCLREPCVMCSMALVHARVKRVFFAMADEKNGALSSRARLQEVSALNHHFEVFTGFLDKLNI